MVGEYPIRSSASTFRQRAVKLAACTIIASFVLMVAFGIFVFWSFDRPPVDIDALIALKVGSSHDEVRKALGKPTGFSDDNREWRYSRAFGWSIVYIYFDEAGGFERFEYDY
jgi:hypothetical protein